MDNTAAPPPTNTPAPAAPADSNHAKADGGAKRAITQQLAKLGKAKDAFKGLGGVLSIVPRALGAVVKSLFAAPLLLFKGDLVEKILSLGFFASIALAAFTSVQIYHFLVKKYHLDQPVKAVIVQKRDFLSEQKDLAKLAANMFMLEKFSATLAPNTSHVDVYEFELFVECDSVQTGEVLKRKLQPIREAIGATIQNRNYDDLLTDSGKEKLKEDILRAINSKLHEADSADFHGRVKRVYFSRFVMG